MAVNLWVFSWNVSKYTPRSHSAIELVSVHGVSTSRPHFRTKFAPYRTQGTSQAPCNAPCSVQQDAHIMTSLLNCSHHAVSRACNTGLE